MKASFASITTPSIRHETEDRILTAEEFIAYQARVSSPHRQHLHESAEDLIRYCLVNSHWSIFDMVDVTFEIETSRAVMAQILRHHSFRFQEFSQRYADPQKAGLGYELVEIRKKHKGGNRQGSGEPDELLTQAAQEFVASSAYDYASLIENGASPETARFVLSLATTTRGFMKGSARSWITYFWQRLDSHAQDEHRDLAWEDFNLFKQHFPICSKIVEGGRSVYVDREKIMAIIGQMQDRPGWQKEIEYLESLAWAPKR